MDNVFENLMEYVKNLRPIDNDAFKVFATYKSFCQEFLRVVLQDPNLIVLENEVQKFLPNFFFKENVLDLLCMLSDGRIVCVEIQLYDEKSHAKRIMTYTSGVIKTMCDRG